MPAPSGNFTPFYGVKFSTRGKILLMAFFFFPSSSQRGLTKLESPPLERHSEQSETPLVTFIKYSFMVMIMNNNLIRRRLFYTFNSTK